MDFVDFFNIHHTFFTVLDYRMSYLEFLGAVLSLWSVWLATRFVEDALGDGAAIRHATHARFGEELQKRHKPYLLLSGGPAQRLAQAVEAFDRILPGVDS